RKGFESKRRPSHEGSARRCTQVESDASVMMKGSREYRRRTDGAPPVRFSLAPEEALRAALGFRCCGFGRRLARSDGGAHLDHDVVGVRGSRGLTDGPFVADPEIVPHGVLEERNLRIALPDLARGVVLE